MYVPRKTSARTVVKKSLASDRLLKLRLRCLSSGSRHRAIHVVRPSRTRFSTLAIVVPLAHYLVRSVIQLLSQQIYLGARLTGAFPEGPGKYSRVHLESFALTHEYAGSNECHQLTGNRAHQWI
jgi:hypothetical protein